MVLGGFFIPQGKMELRFFYMKCWYLIFFKFIDHKGKGRGLITSKLSFIIYINSCKNHESKGVD